MNTQPAVCTAEELICTFINPDNGSSPLWCYGTPTIASDGERVYVSVPETGVSSLPTCNTRLQLFSRDEAGEWTLLYVNPEFDQREPCPVALHSGGRLLVSVNPRVAPFRGSPDGSSIMWYCEPCLLQFGTEPFTPYPEIVKPVWAQPWPFTDHSYRGLAVDADNDDILLFNIEGYLWREGYLGRHHWSYRGRSGQWTRQGILNFPVRACYPAIALNNRQAYVVAISDIDEPNEEWMAYKREVTGQGWDFDFRKLFAAYSPDIAHEDFREPILIDDVDATAGHIKHLDMWIGPDGEAYVLYIRRNIWKAFMRDRFFPGTQIQVELRVAVLKDGAALDRFTLLTCQEQEDGRYWANGAPNGPMTGGDSFRTNDLLPDCGAFHAAADGSLHVIYHMSGVDETGRDISGIYVRNIAAGMQSEPVKVEMQHPLKTFFAAAERTGSKRSDTIDLLGVTGGGSDEVRYARIKLKQGGE